MFLWGLPLSPSPRALVAVVSDFAFPFALRSFIGCQGLHCGKPGCAATVWAGPPCGLPCEHRGSLMGKSGPQHISSGGGSAQVLLFAAEAPWTYHQSSLSNKASGCKQQRCTKPEALEDRSLFLCVSPSTLATVAGAELNLAEPIGSHSQRQHSAGKLSFDPCSFLS